MPRQARIDIPGCLYHVIGRGIERREIFIDEKDYSDFLVRLEENLEDTGSRCFAFCLLPNHFHLLILRGDRSLAGLMRRLMTGYAVRFNRRYQRAGHLFQNRYKALLCDQDSYLLELVSYIHLNPWRAGLVGDHRGLARYRWSGHGTILGSNRHGFLAKEDILRQFGNNLKISRRKYESFVLDRVNRFGCGELSRGGRRYRGGIGTGVEDGTGPARKDEDWVSDERILGEGDFVKAVLDRVEPERSRVEIEEIVDQVERGVGVQFEEILSKCQRRRVVEARAVYCYLAKEHCGMSGEDLARQLRLSSGAISQLFYRGRELARK